MRIVVSLFENAPSLVFLLLLRLEGGIVLSGWLACGLSIAVLATLWHLRQRPDGILLGINLHFLIAAPAIHLAFALGPSGLGPFLLTYAGCAVLIMVFLTGLVLQLARPSGFAERGWALLAIAAGCCLWSFAFVGQQFLSVGLPLLLLFAARRGLGGVALSALLVPPKPQDALFV